MACCGDRAVPRVFANPSTEVGKARCESGTNCGRLSAVQCFYCRKLFCIPHMWNRELCMVCGYNAIGEEDSITENSVSSPHGAQQK